MTRYMLLAAALVATPLLACSDEDSLESLMREYDDEYATQIEIGCDCFADFGYESRSECESGRMPLPAERRCIEDALSRNEEASSDWLGCMVPLEREFTACLDARLQCDDGSSTDACYSDYDLGYANCIQLPETVSRAMDNCFE